MCSNVNKLCIRVRHGCSMGSDLVFRWWKMQTEEVLFSKGKIPERDALCIPATAGFVSFCLMTHFLAWRGRRTSCTNIRMQNVNATQSENVMCWAPLRAFPEFDGAERIDIRLILSFVCEMLKRTLISCIPPKWIVPGNALWLIFTENSLRSRSAAHTKAKSGTTHRDSNLRRMNATECSFAIGSLCVKEKIGFDSKCAQIFTEQWPRIAWSVLAFGAICVCMFSMEILLRFSHSVRRK